MSNYTPGPWTVDNSHPTSISIDADCGDECIEICCVWGTESHCMKNDESLANARLIAAAPCLLEALRHMLGTMLDGPDESDLAHTINKARAAIAKARGME